MIYVPMQRYKMIIETLSTDGNNNDDDSNDNAMKMEKIFKKDALEMNKLRYGSTHLSFIDILQPC